jgi:hypothetical protein
MFLGVTTKDPKYPDFLIAKDIITIPAVDLVPSVEEVKATRAAQ